MTIGEAYICLVGSIWPVYITMRLLVILWKMFNFFFHSEIWNFLSFQKLFISPCCTSKARNVCFVPPRPALMNIPGCISVSNGDEGVACLKAHHAASKPPAFCPENLSTALFALGTTWLIPVGELFVPRQNAEWARSVAGGWVRHIGSLWGQHREEIEIWNNTLCIVSKSWSSRDVKRKRCASWKADWQRGHLKHHKQGFFCRYFALVLKTAKAFIPASALINRMKVNFVNSEWCVLPSSEQVLNIFLS